MACFVSEPLVSFHTAEIIDEELYRLAVRLPHLWMKDAPDDLSACAKLNNLQLAEGQAVEYDTASFAYISALHVKGGMLPVDYELARPTAAPAAKRRVGRPRKSRGSLPALGYVEDPTLFGPLHAQGPSVQTVNKKLRAFFYRRSHVQVAIRAAIPRLILLMARRENIPHDGLQAICDAWESLPCDTRKQVRAIIREPAESAAYLGDAQLEKLAETVRLLASSENFDFETKLVAERARLLGKVVRKVQAAGANVDAIFSSSILVSKSLLEHVKTAIRNFNEEQPEHGPRAELKPFVKLHSDSELKTIAVRTDCFVWTNAPDPIPGESQLEKLLGRTFDSVSELEARVTHLALHLCRTVTYERKIIIRGYAPGELKMLPMKKNSFLWPAHKFRLDAVLQRFPAAFLVRGYYPHLPPNHPEFESNMLSAVSPLTLLHIDELQASDEDAELITRFLRDWWCGGDVREFQAMMAAAGEKYHDFDITSLDPSRRRTPTRKIKACGT